jgi:3,4-dihydroxy 2-butanone 4-phosphate synthase/GTP cyclohydrolase II
MMSSHNGASFGTNFTVSIEAAQGVTTGISAQDRARTILAAANPDAAANDIVMPGHVFPVRANPGGVLVRAGHTEAGCDLARMAGLFPATVICEIMNKDGSMARLDNLITFARTHKIKIGSIQSIIEHRLKNEVLVKREQALSVETAAGSFELLSFRDTVSGQLHLAFCRGSIVPDEPLLVRVLVEPTFLDGVLSTLPSRSWSVMETLRRIDKEGKGALVVLNATDSGNDKIVQQLTDFSAQPPIGIAGRLRTYGIGAQILRNIGAGQIRLLSGKMTLPNMAGFGLEIMEIIER